MYFNGLIILNFNIWTQCNNIFVSENNAVWMPWVSKHSATPPPAPLLEREREKGSTRAHACSIVTCFVNPQNTPNCICSWSEKLLYAVGLRSFRRPSFSSGVFRCYFPLFCMDLSEILICCYFSIAIFFTLY